MSTVQIQIPTWLHESLHKTAAEQNCPIDLFITLAVTEKITLLNTEQYLETRSNAKLLKAAQPIDRNKFY